MAAVSPELDLLVLCELNPDVLVVDANLDIRLGQVERLVADAEITLGSSGAITAAAAAAQGLRLGCAPSSGRIWPVSWPPSAGWARRRRRPRPCSNRGAGPV